MRRKYMRYRWSAERIIRRSVLILIGVALLTSCIYGYRDLLGQVEIYGENRCRNLVTQLVMDAATEVKPDGKLVYFTTSENKSIVELNSGSIRQYQAILASILAEKMDSIQEQTYPVPIGTVIGGVLLMGRGPMIELRYHPSGNISVNMTSRLQQAGINQVLYQVVLEVQTDMTVILPGGTKSINCDQTIVLEEMLISGEVPMVYGG